MAALRTEVCLVFPRLEAMQLFEAHAGGPGSQGSVQSPLCAFRSSAAKKADVRASERHSHLPSNRLRTPSAVIISSYDL